MIPSQVVARTLTAKRGDRYDGDTEEFIAAPLSHGSNPNSNAAGRRREDDINLVAETVRSHPRPGSNSNGNLAFAFHQTQDPIHGHEFSPALGETSIGMGVNQGASVRRLTPTECERLQGLPDGWTRLDDSTPDSRRYAALGDAVTASVGEWIGRRILEAAA